MDIVKGTVLIRYMNKDSKSEGEIPFLISEDMDIYRMYRKEHGDMNDPYFTQFEKQEVEGIEFLKNNGVSVYEPTEEEMNLWHETVFNGTYDYITELIGKDTVDDFLNKAESVLGN